MGHEIIQQDSGFSGTDASIILLNLPPSARESVGGIPTVVFSASSDQYSVTPGPLKFSAETGQPAASILIDEGDRIRTKLVVDMESRMLNIDGREIRLSPHNLTLFLALMERAPHVVKHSELRHVLYPSSKSSRVDQKALIVEIHDLRRRIKPDSESSRRLEIVSVKGIGYRLVDSENKYPYQDTDASQNGYTFDKKTGEITIYGMIIALTDNEAAVFQIFNDHTRNYLNLTDLAKLLPGGLDTYNTGNLRVFIQRIRKKLARDSNHTLEIKCARGAGYTLIVNNQLVDKDVRSYGHLKVYPQSHEVEVGLERVLLSPREYSLLDCLLKHKGEYVDCEMLCDMIFRDHDFYSRNNLTGLLFRLRKKLQLVDAPQPLLTSSRENGYKLNV